MNLRRPSAEERRWSERVVRYSAADEILGELVRESRYGRAYICGCIAASAGTRVRCYSLAFVVPCISVSNADLRQ